MERDWLYFSLIAAGGLLLWALFRHRAPGRGRMSMIASAIAVGLAYWILFEQLQP